MQPVSDEKLADIVINALKTDMNIPVEDMVVKVEKGCVYLQGKVDYHSQREAIGKILVQKYIPGLRGICNLIRTKF